MSTSSIQADSHAQAQALDFVAGHCACTAVAYVLDLSTEQDLLDSGSQPQGQASASNHSKQSKPIGLTLSTYCHCSKCQRFNGAPFVWTTHWKEESVTWFPPPEVEENVSEEEEGESLEDGDELEQIAEEETEEGKKQVSGQEDSIQNQTSHLNSLSLTNINSSSKSFKPPATSDPTSNPLPSSNSSDSSSSSSESSTSTSSSSSSETEPKFSPSLSTYESMPGRKWKLRCKVCGSPMGSWNEFKKEWTIWPSTLEHSSNSDSISTALLDLIRPTGHQFYGSWRLMDVHDGLEKWEGYEGKSLKVE